MKAAFHILCAAALAAAAARGDGALPQPRRSARDAALAAFNAPRNDSMDGFIRVRSYPGDTEFRIPVMRAAQEVVEAVAARTGLQIPRGEPGIVICIRENGEPGDTRVIENTVLSAEGRIATWITLPSPGYCSLDRFRRACATAFFRAWTDRNRTKFGKPLPEMPEWVAEGVLRSCGKEFRLRDADAVLELWRGGGMPFFPRLFAGMRMMESQRGRALCGVFALWMCETPAKPLSKKAPGKSTVFTLQMERLAAGIPWDPASVLAGLAGSDDPQAQDAAFDERMARNIRAWLNPGHPAPWEARAFASRLSLVAPFWDGPFSDGTRACGYRRALALYSGDARVRMAAALAVRGVLAAGEGRGPEMKAAAAAYAKFLEALATPGTKREDAAELLDEAEARLAEVAEAAAALYARR